MASQWVELTSTDGGKVFVNLAIAATIHHFDDYTSISFGTGAGTMNVREAPATILGALKSLRAPIDENVAGADGADARSPR